jgi:DNA-binding response OmpR family regulator
MCPRRHRHVLLVEDEWLIAAQMADILTAQGLEVVGPAPNVRQAFALLENNDVCLAILDVNLGKEKSFPVAHALAERNIPLLFVTGYLDRDLPPQFAGRPLLSKPVDPQQLHGVIKQLLNPASKGPIPESR